MQIEKWQFLNLEMLIVTLTDTYFAKYIIDNKARCDNNIMITKKKKQKKTEICWSCFKK